MTAPYHDALLRIAAAIPQATSIDHLLDHNRGDKHIELCGKLAIVRTILEAEKGSELCVKDEQSNHPHFASLGGTWYSQLWQQLIDGYHKDQYAKFFDNVSFIVFNYDRCIEHFLESLQD